jgi:hypothetical protein
MTGTSSANPSKLEAAAQAVPAELRTALASAPAVLNERVAVFTRGHQSPDRITVSADALAGSLATVVARGNQLDAHLIRVAAAFRTAGGNGRPPGFVGPIAGDVLRLDDGVLLAELARWNDPQPLAFRPGPDGGYEVRGPDGHWYTMRDAPPVGGVPLDRQQEVTDFGNSPWFAVSAAFIIGVTGGQTQPMSRAAPPSAYEHIHLDENGYPVAEPGVTGHTPVLGGRPPGDPPPDPDSPQGNIRAYAFEGAALGLNGLIEAGKHANARHKNVFRTQTTFYVDPQSGQRVAVVDAASIRYSNDDNEAIVTSGRLSSDDDGRAVLVPRPPDPPDPDAPACPSPDQQAMRPPTTLRIPLEEKD